MIKGFKHKGLRAYWEQNDPCHLNASWLSKIARVLDMLDVAEQAEDMNLPGFYFHALKGRYLGRYSVRLTGNWRITFAFEGKDAIHVDLEDYH